MVMKQSFKLTEVGEIPEDWEVKKLDEIASVTSGKRLPKGFTLSDKINSHPYIRIMDIIDEKISLLCIKYVPEEIVDSIKKYRVFGGELIITVAGTLGIVCNIPFKLDGANLTENANRISNIQCNAEFLKFILRSPFIQKIISSIQTIGAQPKLALEKIRKFDILTPSAPEQAAIAASLSDTDSLISSLEQLIAKKRLIKQGAMQELLTGKRRLPGFEGEWKEIFLGDALHVCHGKNQKAVDSPNGFYPIFGSGGHIGLSTQYLSEGPSVLIGRKGTIDKPQYIDSPFWTIDTLFYTDFYICHYPKFFYYLFCVIDWQKLNEASGVPSLSAYNIENIRIKVPEAVEQFSISAVLSDMDGEIAALEARLEKTRKIKKGMMVELLTGKIRLI